MSALTATASDRSASVECVVPFHDCDPLFVVWHGRYFEYFAAARTQLFKSCEIDVGDVRALGYRMYMTDARCRYLFPMSYDDRVRITARFKAIEPLLKITYRIHNLTHDRVCARGYTDIATTDSSGNLIPSTPQELVRRING